MKKLLLVAILFAGYTLSYSQFSYAFSTQKSNSQISGQGVVTRLLPDDNNGSRHQKFIIKLPSGQTLLIAHNIDLAPRINALREGDSIRFYGEYEWNAKGGAVHWTHQDPNGFHQAGWNTKVNVISELLTRSRVVPDSEAKRCVLSGIVFSDIAINMRATCLTAL